MGTYSAGLVLYRRVPDHQVATANSPKLASSSLVPAIEILLVHPGGPYWVNKDKHGWSIPKGEYDPSLEDGWIAAQREFEEELGSPAPTSHRIELDPIKTSSKTTQSWLVEGDFNPESLVSNSFEIEWPPRSGQMQDFPEVDKCAWFNLVTAEIKLHKGQLPLVAKIAAALNNDSS